MRKKQKFEVEKSFVNCFEINDEKEEQSSDHFQHIEKPMVYDDELDHKEGNEGSQINVSPYFSNSEISHRGEVFCLLDPVGENDSIFTEVYTKDEVLNSEILREGHDVSFKNCREYLLHSSVEGQFDCMEKGLLPK